MKKRLARKVDALQYGTNHYRKPTRWIAYRQLVRAHLRGLRRGGRITLSAFLTNLPSTAHERSVELSKAYQELATPAAASGALAA